MRTIATSCSYGAFTLIEVMLVVVLLCVIAMMVMPAPGHVASDRLKCAARLLVADIEYAQMRSVENGLDPCVVSFDPVGQTYHLAQRSTPLVPIVDPVRHGAYRTKFGTGRAASMAGVNIDSVSAAANNRIEFTAFGSLQQPATPLIVLKSGSQTIRVKVDPSTGEPRVE